jgi:GTP:adenosylcobinamide-phosphate guanylyltransferase
MSELVDAIVLAGDGRGSRAVAGRSKILLPINGKPLLAYVLEALAAVDRIRRVITIGPKRQIEDILSGIGQDTRLQARFIALEQHETAYDNFWDAFLVSLGHYEEGLEQRDREVAQKAVFVVPADLPLIGVQEVNEFLDAAIAEGADYCIGMTDEKHLRRFCPTDTLPGIRMNYLHLADGNLRLNNLHFIRPFQVKNRMHIQQIYEFRYQKEFLNIVKVIADILTTSGFGLRPVYLYARLQMSALFKSLGWERSLAWSRRGVTRADMTRYAGVMLQARVSIVETHGGGCAVDVDTEADYDTIKCRFAEFSSCVD